MQRLTTCAQQSFPGGSDRKESACNVKDLGSIPGLGGPPGGGNSNPLQYSCLENPRGQRSLAGYSPWGHKESDTTEQLSSSSNSPKTCSLLCKKKVRKHERNLVSWQTGKNSITKL